MVQQPQVIETRPRRTRESQWQFALGTAVWLAQYFIGARPGFNVHVCCFISPDE